MVDEDQISAVQLMLVAFYGGGFSSMMRRADIWFPFTPTFTATPSKWVGWQDALRFALSGLFLIFLPAMYFLWILIMLNKEPAAFLIHLTPPALSDIIVFVVVVSLISPQLGFYNLWQAIVCALPSALYSDEAKLRIEEVYPNAFRAGQGARVAWGFGWIFIPTWAFIVVLSGLS
jgi:hypothetical protein